MTRSDDDEWDIVTSVGYTALVVAGWRALHAAGPDPLVRDEYAKHFIAASGDPYLTGLLADPGTSDGATAFPRLYGVQTRFFDEFFMSATGDTVYGKRWSSPLVWTPKLIGSTGQAAQQCSRWTSRKFWSSKPEYWPNMRPSPLPNARMSQQTCASTGQYRCRQ